MSYQTRFFSNLEKVYNAVESFYPDVTLHCMEDNTKRKCHRVVLSIASEYFINVFSYNNQGCDNVVEVRNGITGDVLDLVLTYIYSGKITLSLDNVTDVLVAADYFNLPELLELCIPLISKNLSKLDVQSCIDMFLLSWKLRLTKLLKRIAPLIALSFPEILNDDILHPQLMTFHPQLMAILLNSDDLVIFDKNTKLPSGPAEREKGILEFLLYYTCHLRNEKSYINNITDEDVNKLLKCIKWPLLNIFEEGEYVFNTFANNFDSGKRTPEIRVSFYMTHSAWFLSSASSSSYMSFEEASETDKVIYGTRAYTCTQLIHSDTLEDDVSFLFGNNKENFEVHAQESEHLSGLDIFIRSAMNKSSEETTILGGICLHLTSGKGTITSHHYGIAEEKALHVYKIRLKHGEYITNVSAQSFDCDDDDFGFYSYPLKFETNEKQTFGPFGGKPTKLSNFGDNNELMSKSKLDNNIENKLDNIESKLDNIEKNYSSRSLYHCYQNSRANSGPRACSTLDSILVGVKGRVNLIQDDLAIIDIKFIFREFLPCSNFFINSRKQFGRSCDDSDNDNGSVYSSDVDYYSDYHFSYSFNNNSDEEW